jgi:hypothetical protein
MALNFPAHSYLYTLNIPRYQRLVKVIHDLAHFISYVLVFMATMGRFDHAGLG